MDLSKCLAQTQAHRALRPGNTVCLPWGRGIGKSFFTRLAWYLLIAQWDGKYRPGADTPGIRIVLLMPTLKQAKRVHANLMVSELAPGGPWGFLGGRINRTDWKIEFPGGSWLQWVSAENADDNRGIRCDVTCVDEADDVDPEIVDAITKPWFSEPHSLRMTIISGTPRRGRYGLLWRAHKEWPEKNPSRFYSFHATAYDAPRLVDPEYLKEVKETTVDEVFKREWLCDFDAAEGLVYSMFSERIHVRRPFAQFHTFLVGVDHGFEDPAVFLVVGVAGSGRDTICHVVSEFYKSHQTSSDLVKVAAQLKVQYPGARWFADPSRPDAIEEYRRRHIKIQPAMNSIEDGVVAVADRLAVRYRDGDGDTPAAYTKLFVAPECRNTIVEFGKYRRKRDPRNRERILDDIEDKNNHAMDALRYAIFTYFGSPTVRREMPDDYFA